MAGAGFVLFRYFPDGIKFLGLVGPEFQRIRTNGTYDIPKGTVDFNESPYQAAVREAEEEAGYKITDNTVIKGPFREGLLIIWLAQVYDDPVIVANPHSGIVEHEGFKWLKPEELLDSCYNYLKPFVEWASEELE